jgi:phospholipid/cholesterol/gamma-HCH transport system substrate-binding protein
MAKGGINNIKLGIFVLAGLLFLVLLLYMIGKNRNLFGATYELKARFDNVQGLVTGSNIRFAGIEAGTVKKINILSDSVIEVIMIIQNRMQTIIKKNAIASIGTEGFVGNKVVNIIPSKENAAPAKEGDILITKRSVNTEEMLETLYKTNEDVAEVAANLKITVQRINNSNVIWKLMDDTLIPNQIKQSLTNIKSATKRADSFIDDLNIIIKNAENGKGLIGSILNDTTIFRNLKDAVINIKKVSIETDSLVLNLKSTINEISKNINNGKGIIQHLLKDSTIPQNIQLSIENIQKGTDGFNKNMEALKHNFLFRGYFRKLEKINKPN